MNCSTCEHTHACRECFVSVPEQAVQVIKKAAKIDIRSGEDIPESHGETVYVEHTE